jgi:hypothetical protein
MRGNVVEYFVRLFFWLEVVLEPPLNDFGSNAFNLLHGLNVL